MDLLSYNQINTVMSSWEKMKQRDGIQEEFGVLLLEKLFLEDPKTKEVFGFAANYNTSSPLAKMGLLVHGLRMVNMFDTILSSILGPDMDMATEILGEVGERHERMGVSKSMFPAMGKALIGALNETITMNQETKEAWRIVYAAVSADMTKAMK